MSRHPSSDGVNRGSSPWPNADAYLDLLSRTRSLPNERRTLRDDWWRALDLESKEEILFELEVLLKGIACFSNPRNHPGPPRRVPIAAQDFRAHALMLRDVQVRAVDLIRQLLGERDRAFVFHRYLETMLPEDNARSRLVSEGLAQGTPEESLVTLRHSMTSTIEVVEGIVRAPRVPFRLFYALSSLLEREIGSNAFFNPLTALEFRPEFDRIHSHEVLGLIRRGPAGEAHRLVALTFLSLFRMLRYLELLDRIVAEAGPRHRAPGRALFVLSVLRSDARALGQHLQRRSGALLADSFHRDVNAVRAEAIHEQSSSLRAEGHRLVGLKSALEGIAGTLRLELRRTFVHDLPAPNADVTDRELRDTVKRASLNLRPALRNTILFLARALGTALEERGVFDDDAARRETSERLRRDVWMFAQIVRAFHTKAQHSPGSDRWTVATDFGYVREFLAYFRSMGYPLLRAGDYPRVDAFMGALGRLQDTDLVDPARLSQAIEECAAFHDFLQQLFDDISRRDVLDGVAFNRRAAARALRLYLGDP